MKKKHSLKRITRFLEEIEWAFELNNFERTISVMESQPEEWPTLTAEVVPDMVYKSITIKIYPNFWTLDLESQRAALLHELVHTILQDTKMYAIDLLKGVSHNETDIKNTNEKAVTTVTWLLNGLLQGKFRYARKAYKNYLKEKV